VSVFSRQAGDRAMWQLLAGLLVVAMAAWMMGLAQRRGSTARVWAMAAPVVAVAGLVLGLSAVRSPVPAGAEADEFWAAWSPERVSELRSAGTPVFVNFTADWCLSCQVNERVVFASDGVRDLFRRYGVAALKADWTNEDERISRALADFGREGVPLYVLYPGRSGTAPHVLPQVPTHSALAEAFASTLQTADPIRSAKNERS